MEENNITSNKRIAKNTIALYIRMMLQMAIGLYTSRVVLNALGVNDFGIYNVVGSVTAMLSFINGSMSNATMRFITFEEGKGNFDVLNKVFCTSMNIHIAIALLTFLVLDTFGLWFLYHKMVIEPQRLTAAFWVLQFSIVTCIVDIISVPYNACIIAHEKMGAFAFISLLQQVATLVLALFLPIYGGDRLILYSVILMLVQILIRIIYGQYCKRYFKETTFHCMWDEKLTKEMATFAGWTMNGNIAWLGYTQGLNILINLFSGTAVNAARGIAFTVQSKIMGFCDNFQVAVKPQITKTYSVGEYQKMHQLIISSSKFSFYLMLFLSLPIFIEIEDILRLWLKIVPEHTVNFVRIILLCSVIDIFRNPMNTAIHATGKIKKYQLWEATTLLLIIPVAYLALYCGLPIEAAFCVQLIIFIVVQIERVFIVCPAIKMSKMKYVKELLKPTCVVTVAAIVLPCALLLIWPLEQNNWLQFFVYISLSFICSFFSIYYLGLNIQEKKKVLSFIQKKFRKI